MSVKKILLRIVVLGIILIISAQYLRIAQGAFRNFKQIIATSEEQRKGRAYESFGYDYVTRIVSFLPDPQIFPVTRYVNYTHTIDALLPINIERIDPRVLIAINIPESDLHEALIASAHRQASFWTFHTTNDYDSLSSLHFRFAEGARGPMQITLYRDSTLTRVLGTWEYSPGKAGDKGVFTLPKSLLQFSFTRGSRDFVLELKPDYAAAIDVYGTKVDLTDYEVVDREGNNFTAIEKTFLARIRRDHMADWILFLSKRKS